MVVIRKKEGPLRRRMGMETITSKENRWVKLAGKLKSKKYRDREGRFLMEGLRSVEDAFRQGRREAVVFVTEAALSAPRVRDLVSSSEALGWLWLCVGEALMKALSDTEHGQGILAMVRKDAPDFRAISFPLTGFYVLLDGVQDPGNMGTILRTAAAAGCRGVFLTEGCTDPYAEKAVRSSMGSVLRLPIYERLGLAEVRTLAEKSGLPLVGTALSGGMPYKSAGALPGAVFVFGNEGNGVRPEVLSLCEKRLYIPMAGGVESLNVSISAAVILFHFSDSDGLKV